MVDVVVVGAGVIGLSAAVDLQEAGYKTAVVAEIFPNDPKSIRYTSFWGGALQGSPCSFSDTELHQINKRTFARVEELYKKDSSLPLAKYTVERHLLSDGTSPEDQDRIAAFKDVYDVKDLPKEELLPDAKYAFRYEAYGFDAPNYILYLLKRYIKAGGSGAHAYLESLASLADGEVKLSLVVGLPLVSQEDIKNAKVFVNASGLFGREIKDIADPDVYQVRGQTVIVRAPWITKSIIINHPHTNRYMTYVIPRKSGEVILGGVYADYETDPVPDPELATEFVQRALDLYPNLVPKEKRADPSKPQISDLDIISHNVGFRPGRKGGVRIEAEPFRTSSRTVTLVHDYGHKSFGYMTSWGSAEKVKELVDAAFNK